jgi:hypothetical protein
MAFGEDFLQGFAGNDSLRDYQHAAKTFLSNGYELAPRNKFLFHVYFNVNLNIPTLKTALKDDVSKIGLLVKTVKLPSFNISVDSMNQYNRKRLVQTKIDYQPCDITFHDDSGDLIRNLWYNYYSYYYKDPTYQYDGGGQPVTNGTAGPLPLYQSGQSYNVGDQYSPSRTANDWGYIGDSYTDTAPNALNTTGIGSGKQSFFRDIRIFGMSQHSYAAYILINPLITTWTHDTYNYGEGGGIMEHSVNVKYEAVKYYSGAVGASRPDTYVQGFGDPAYYDTIRSPLARPGSTQSVLGQGGLIDAGLGIYDDLTRAQGPNILGAVQKATTVFQTWKKVDARAVINNEARAAVQTVLRQVSNSPTVKQVFPTPPRQT